MSTMRTTRKVGTATCHSTCSASEDQEIPDQTPWRTYDAEDFCASARNHSHNFGGTQCRQGGEGNNLHMQSLR